jgi:hypothetical protein
MLRSITAEGHSGQTDKAGAPYVLHPLRVMLSVTTNEERIVAVLHDLVEDCPGWSFERLREEGFSEAGADGVGIGDQARWRGGSGLRPAGRGRVALICCPTPMSDVALDL